MLLIIAFTLFVLIIAAWIVAPATSSAHRQEPAPAPSLAAIGSRAV